MFSKSEILEAIDELERSPATYQNAEKLSTFYLLYDHLYAARNAPEAIREVVIGKYGDSDFLRQIDGMEAQSVWLIIDELMETIRAMNPRLYEATIQQIRQ